MNEALAVRAAAQAPSPLRSFLCTSPAELARSVVELFPVAAAAQLALADAQPLCRSAAPCAWLARRAAPL